MKVFIKRNCAAGGQHLEAGKTYELPDQVGRALVTMGRATAAGPKDKAEEPIQVRDPQLQSRDPQIAIGDEANKMIAPKRGK